MRGDFPTLIPHKLVNKSNSHNIATTKKQNFLLRKWKIQRAFNKYHESLSFFPLIVRQQTKDRKRFRNGSCRTQHLKLSIDFSCRSDAESKLLMD
ncbi:hypothetical protein Gura_3009 [Geotalea uraniireducens Rf4]|uniref:Uncharacterized protein n=1 Tax=Geotalea uraniireducens (strain Rf4) TaxID=351605 RepID=A5G5W3_GEOUR|nr:hypothetical protein Gura_3009 [Geotalea uraniireducens Rf4]